MKLPHRRQFLHLAAGAAVLPSVSRIARAQDRPSKPVRIIVGFTATMTRSDFSCPCIIGFGSSRCGPSRSRNI